jgi:acyl-CoA synthetase (AMP-forming)/AMP-acid ligase II
MLRGWEGSRDAAVVSSDATWSGNELLRYAAGATDWLDGVGALHGRPVPALVTSSPATFALVVAAATSGRPLAPLGPRHTRRELSACLSSLSSPVLVTEPEWEHLAREAAGTCGMKVATLAEPSCSNRRLELQSPEDGVAFILHTSGTTGLPKAVPYRQDRMARRTEVVGGLAGLAPGASLATASPFHHIAGWGHYAVALGAGAAVIPVPRFTVDAWRELAGRRPTNALLVPTMIEMLLDEKALDLVDLRMLHYGASQIHPETLARVIGTLPHVGLLNLFGQTEGSPITGLMPEDHVRALDGTPHLLASVGRAAPGVELRIHDPDPAGVGEVHAKAFHLMRPDPDGWLRTGDLGRLDAEGYLYLSGRIGDRIVRGGENIHPQEVEHVLCEHPSVKDCAVVGIADRKWGQQVKAFVVAADPAKPPDFDELREWSRTQLAGFKVPAFWVLVDELPRNPSGKVLRRELIGADRSG